MSLRYELREEEWDRIRESLPGKAADVVRTAKDKRQFVNGVLWILRTGSPWSELPERYGRYKSVHKRYSRWCKKGVWERVLSLLTEDKDCEYLMMDSTVVRAHSQAAAFKKRSGSGKVSRRVKQ